MRIFGSLGTDCLSQGRLHRDSSDHIGSLAVVDVKDTPFLSRKNKALSILRFYFVWCVSSCTYLNSPNGASSFYTMRLFPIPCPRQDTLRRRKSTLQVEYLLQDFHCLLRVLDAVTDGSTVLVNLEIIPAFESFISEEMDIRILHSTELFFFLEMLKAVGFIPTSGENIEGDLAAYRVPIS